MTILPLPVDPALGRRAALEQALREAIRSGRLPPGTPLPSSRVLATERGLARATVVAAYEQLAAEGYVVARHGVGTTVADVRIPAVPREAPNHDPTLAFDFRPGEPDSSLFPRSAWLRSVRRTVKDAPDELFGYGDPRGRAELRSALTTHLGRSRAVFAPASSISIFGGFTSALGFLAEALVRSGIERIGVEDPSLFFVPDVLRLVGASPVPVPVDEDGIDVAELERRDVGAVIVTPSHQYPLGVTMAPERRTELIEWARDRNSWIVEDDYDGEFRYDRQPIGSLQGLDPDRVVYAGTASKSLAPGLRLAWLVAPPALQGPLGTVKHLRAGVSSIEQVALADFIGRGELDRHVRHVRAIYEDRQRLLSRRLSAEIPWLEIPRVRAGLHITATIRDGYVDEATLVRQAAERSIGLLPLAPHWADPPSRTGIVLGYSRPPQHGFAEALDQLVGFLREI